MATTTAPPRLPPAHNSLRAAFERWMLSELATHYLAPCPDEVMNPAVEQANTDVRALAEMPVATAEDLLLKVFTLVLIENSPRLGDPPLVPVNDPVPDSDYQEDALWRAIIRDLPKVSPTIAIAMSYPYRLSGEEAAA